MFEPTIRVWRSGTARKQPANLAVESAEESLSIISDYTPTVRPRPSAVDHLDRDAATFDLLSHCHRHVMSGVHSGSLRAERGWGDGCEWRAAVVELSEADAASPNRVSDGA